MSKSRNIGDEWKITKKGIQYAVKKVGPRQYERTRLSPYLMPNRANGRGKGTCQAARTARAPKRKPAKEAWRFKTKAVDMSLMKQVRIDAKTVIVVSKSIPDEVAISNFRKKHSI